MSEKKYCELCNIPMFRYKIIHNGTPEVVWRCMSPHGVIDANGRVRQIKGKTTRKGVKKQFRNLFGRLELA